MNQHPLVRTAPTHVPTTSVHAPLALSETHALASPSPAPAPAQPLTVVTLLRGLRYCWRKAIVVSLAVGFVAAVAFWLILPPSRPFAYAKIYFPTNPDRVLNEHPDPPLKEQTQKERILSRKVLSKAAARPELAELLTIREQGDPVAFLSRELQIDFPPGTEIMKITLHGDRPEELRIIVDAVKETYLSEIKEESESRRDRRETDLRVKHAKAEADYNAALDAALKSGQGIGGDPQTIAYMRRRLEEQRDLAESELSALRRQIEKANRDLKILMSKQSGPIDVNDSHNDPYFAADEELVLLARRRKEVERRLADRKRIVAPDHPSIKDIEAEIRSVDSRIVERKEELKPFVETRFKQQLSIDIARLSGDIHDNTINEQKLVDRIARLKDEAKDLGMASVNSQGSHKELMKLRDEADSFDRALKKLLSERDAPIRANTLEDAIIVVPSATSRKNMFALVGFVGVFGLSLLAFAFSEYRVRRIGNADEVLHNLGMPIMGTVPARPARSVGRADLGGPVAAEQVLWQHLTEESVDSARTLFLHTAEANALRVVMITSAVGSEGKTSLSCQLARSLARSGRRVLLIDGDLRNPSIHGQFGFGDPAGVCEVLRSERSPNEVIRPTPVPNLWVICAGRCEKLALQNLAMDAFRNLIAEVRGQYDFVLVDTSPVLPVADAMLMARHVDGVLLSLMCEISQVERVQTACARLTSIGARIVGAVLHGTRESSGDYGPRYLMPVQTS